MKSHNRLRDTGNTDLESADCSMTAKLNQSLNVLSFGDLDADSRVRKPSKREIAPGNEYKDLYKPTMEPLSL